MIDASVTECRNSETKLEWNQQGVRGTDGTNGTNGVAGYEIVSRRGTETVTLSGQKGWFEKISCPAGKAVLGGDVEASISVNNVPEARVLTYDGYPSMFQGTGSWGVTIGKLDYSDMTADEVLNYTIYATCATMSS